MAQQEIIKVLFNVDDVSNPDESRQLFKFIHLGSEDEIRVMYQSLAIVFHTPVFQLGVLHIVESSAGTHYLDITDSL